MARPVERLATTIRAHAWWVAPPLVIALVAGALVGYPLVWLAYVVLNVGGVAVYCDHLGQRLQRRQRWAKMLAIVMVPVGFVGMFAPSGQSPRDIAVSGSGPEVAEGTAGAPPGTADGLGGL